MGGVGPLFGKFGPGVNILWHCGRIGLGLGLIIAGFRHCYHSDSETRTLSNIHRYSRYSVRAPSFVDMMVLYYLYILPPLTHYCLQQILSLFQICQQFCLLCFHLLLLQPFQCLHINLVPFVHGSAKRAVYKHYTQIAQITEICHFLEKIIYIKT